VARFDDGSRRKKAVRRARSNSIAMDRMDRHRTTMQLVEKGSAMDLAHLEVERVGARRILACVSVGVMRSRADAPSERSRPLLSDARARARMCK
jgi:hypothetical protein